MVKSNISGFGDGAGNGTGGETGQGLSEKAWMVLDFAPLAGIAVATAAIAVFFDNNLMASLLAGGFFAGVAHLGFGIGGRKQAHDAPAQPTSGKHPAEQLAASAQATLHHISSRAASVEDDEVNFRAGRLRNTVTLLIEALRDDPDRHGELQNHLGHSLMRIRAAVDAFVPKFSANRDGSLRGEFLRYLQEAELQFEYAARSFVLGGRATSY